MPEIMHRPNPSRATVSETFAYRHRFLPCIRPHNGTHEPGRTLAPKAPCPVRLELYIGQARAVGRLGKRTKHVPVPEITIAKIYREGRKQSVRIPAQFQFPGNRLHIRRLRGAVLLEPIFSDYEQWISALDRSVGRFIEHEAFATGNAFA